MFPQTHPKNFLHCFAMKKIIALVLVIVVAAVIYLLNTALPSATGYASKYLCSQVFVAGRDAGFVFENEIQPMHPLFAMLENTLDAEKQTVTSAAFGFWQPLTAMYRPGFGCTLMIDTTREELLAQTQGATPQDPPKMAEPWPMGEQIPADSIPEGVDLAKLQEVLEEAFQEPGTDTLRNTQAIVVVYRGNIIAEKYHPQFTPQTPMIGWSMSKTVMGALVGILAKQGKLKLDEPAPVLLWKNANDGRNEVTLDQLMRMSSGLEFEEKYDPATDATLMLYESKSMGDYAASKPLAHAPDTVFHYSSGTTNILSQIVRDATGGTLVRANNFIRQELFDPLGAKTSLIEPDASGSPSGSSYMFASPRDWARVGLFLIQNGVWNEESILPEGWVAYMKTPTPAAEKEQYGAQLWLNARKNDYQIYPSLPEDMVYLGGYNEQIVAIFPSHDLVVVRLGVTLDDSWDVEDFLRKILEALPQA